MQNGLNMTSGAQILLLFLWSSQLFDLRVPLLSTDITVLLLNQPYEDSYDTAPLS